MRGEKLEHLVITGMIEEKHSIGKQRPKMLDGLTKWLVKVRRVTGEQKATRDRDSCRAKHLTDRIYRTKPDVQGYQDEVQAKPHLFTIHM